MPDVHLAIVGEPHPRELDHKYAQMSPDWATRSDQAGEHLHGIRGRGIEDAYAAASVVVNPARYEAFGRVAFEALLAGQPVVSTSVGAVSELLRDGVDALLVPSERPQALAAAVTRILSDGDLARRLAESGKARVQAELAPSSIHCRRFKPRSTSCSIHVAELCGRLH